MDHSRLLVFMQTRSDGDACSDQFPLNIPKMLVKSPPVFFHQLSPEVGSTTLWFFSNHLLISVAISPPTGAIKAGITMFNYK